MVTQRGFVLRLVVLERRVGCDSETRHAEATLATVNFDEVFISCSKGTADELAGRAEKAGMSQLSG